MVKEPYRIELVDGQRASLSGLLADVPEGTTDVVISGRVELLGTRIVVAEPSRGLRGIVRPGVVGLRGRLVLDEPIDLLSVSRLRLKDLEREGDPYPMVLWPVSVEGAEVTWELQDDLRVEDGDVERRRSSVLDRLPESLVGARVTLERLPRVVFDDLDARALPCHVVDLHLTPSPLEPDLEILLSPSGTSGRWARIGSPPGWLDPPRVWGLPRFSVPDATLVRRVGYGGRKGRRALRRLRTRGC